MAQHTRKRTTPTRSRSITRVLLVLVSLVLAVTILLTPRIAAAAAVDLYAFPSWHALSGLNEIDFSEHPATKTNCLAYALGYDDRYIWPWFGMDPTVPQVDAFMYSVGYEPCSPAAGPNVIAYGVPWSDVNHFARVVSSTTIEAKWGQFEWPVLSRSWNPYLSVSRGGFGFPVAYYKRTGATCSIVSPTGY
jgi:hypothetical protein